MLAMLGEVIFNGLLTKLADRWWGRTILYCGAAIGLAVLIGLIVRLV